jgi:hypothetical protein
MLKTLSLSTVVAICATLVFPSVISRADWSISEPMDEARLPNNETITANGFGPVSTAFEVAVWWDNIYDTPVQYVEYYTRQGTTTPEGTWSKELGMPPAGAPFFGKWVLDWNWVRLNCSGPGGVSHNDVLIFDGTAM